MVHLQPQSQWRRRLDRLSAIGIVLLGLVVLVAAVIALRQPNGHRAAALTSTTPAGARTSAAKPGTNSSAAPASTAAPSTAPTPTTPSTSPGATTVMLKAIPLIVLNNTNTTGLAQKAAQTFTSGGWTVASYSNYQNNIISTCAYYDPADPRNQQAAEALEAQFPQIQRVKAKFEGLPSGPVVVVLTSDYS